MQETVSKHSDNIEEAKKSESLHDNLNSDDSRENVARKKVKLSSDQSEVFEKKEETPNPATNKPNDPKDDMLEIVTCSICSDIMHDCISLQPCLHTYCAGCYSEWMAKSNQCPICKKVVERISKNHIVNNIIENFLKNNPEKKRSDQDLKELDTKNKITHDMVSCFRDRLRKEKNNIFPIFIFLLSCIPLKK